MEDRTLARYRIAAKFGGGMGEVYRAYDTRLGRDVAIEALPPASTNDPERRDRQGGSILATGWGLAANNWRFHPQDERRPGAGR